MNRRTLIQLAPTLAAFIATEAGLEGQPKSAGPASKFSKEQIETALALLGIEFPPEQRQMLLPNIGRALNNYENLRKINVPLDTEPAFHFHPGLPGRDYGSGRGRVVYSRPAKPLRRPGALEDLAFASALDIGRLIRARQITSLEVTKMYIERLKRYSPKLLCLVTLTEDLALEQARRADAEVRARKIRGPLHGVPYGAKDLFATKGIPTTWGAEPFEKQVIDYNATVIERMEKAGAVLLGKLSMGALAQGGLWFRGMTKNPWNTEQTSSGSSAGSASATSAGLVGFSLGTETLGSIVSPCTRCGCAGLRPTYGRISRFGAMGLSWTMDKVGPICRTVEDCAAVLDAAYGPDGKDETVGAAPFHFNATAPIGKMRIGYVKADFDKLDGERRKVFDRVLADMKRAGVNLKPVEMPPIQTGPMLMLLTAEASAAFDDITRDRQVERLRGQAPSDWPNTFRAGRLIPAVEYIRAQRARTLLMREMDKVMSQWDVLISLNSTLGVTNLTGHPQVVVPCGFVNKEPVSVLFTGRLYDEGAPLRVAMAYEHATDWHTMHPPVNWT